MAERRQTRLRTWTIRHGAWALAGLFVLSGFWLLNTQHSAFNTLVYDFARFTQAIWSTAHGRFLFETIKYGSILGNHFSPIMAWASPLVVLTGTERVLFLIQVVNVAATGLILHRLFRERHPQRPGPALLFLLAFYLNPAVHDITLSEVRRVVFGMPFLALGLYGLGTHRRGWMLAGFGLALLAKESVAIPVAMAGLYLLIIERDIAWGLGVTALGAAWLVGVSLWVIPSIGAADNPVFVYPQLYYFDHLGGSYGEIAGALLGAPLGLLRQMFGPQQVAAIGRLLLPLGLVLPLLAPAWAFIAAPFAGIMFLSREPRLVQLTHWYTATIMPVLFSAIAMGWRRIPERGRRWAMGWLLATTLVGVALFSPTPLGGHYDRELYRISDHDRIVAKLLREVPRTAKVAAQDRYIPHLALRHDIYHYPWIRIGEDSVEVFVLDRNAGAYPLTQPEIGEIITNKVTNPDIVVVAEGDGCFVLSRIHEPAPAYTIDRVAEGTMRLDAVEVAIADADGIYRSAAPETLVLTPGDQVRVSLLWTALDAPGAERTVSVRVATDGALVAQHDGLPGEAGKPTSWWEAGWRVRDVHYLTVAPGASPGAASLDVLLYDSATLAIVPFAGDDGAPTDVLHVAPVTIR